MALGGGGGGAGAKAGDVRAGGAYVEVSAKDSLTKTLGKLQAKVKGFSEGLRKIGVSTALAGAATLTPIAMLLKGGVDRAEEINRLAEELGFTVQEMQRLKYAADVTGDSLERVIGDQEKYADLLAEAPVMDDQAIRDSVEANREWRKTLIELQQAITPLISEITPLIQWIGKLARENKTAAGIVAGLGVALLAIGGAASSAGVFIAAASAAFSAMAAALPAIIGAGGAVIGFFAAFGSELAVVAVAVTAIWTAAIAAVTAFLKFTETGQELVRTITTEFNDLLGIAKSTFGGIVSAISKGDLAAAWDVAFASLKVVFAKFEVWATRLWVRMKNVFVNAWNAARLTLDLNTLDFAAWLMRNDPTGFLSGGMTDSEINAARDSVQNDAAKDYLRKERENDNFRNAQIANAERELAEARKNLDRAVGAANAPEPAGRMKNNMYQFPQIDAVRGAFRVFNGAMQFGGSVAKQQLDVAKEQDKKLAALVGEMNDLNRNLRFA